MKNLARFVLLPIVLFSFSFASFPATFEHINLNLSIEGEIVAGDYEKFLTAYFKAAKRLDDGSYKYIQDIRIRSPGGNFQEAIKIANFVEQAKLTVWAPDECNSACVFIVIGAAKRGVQGDRLGLHRPYIARSSYNHNLNQDAEKGQKEVMKFARSWLEERFVPRDIIDTLIYTPSFEIKYMKSDEFLQKIGFRAPVHQEWVAALCGFMSENESMLATAYPKYQLYKKYGSDYLRSQGWIDDLRWIEYAEKTGRIVIMEDASNKQLRIVDCEIEQVQKFVNNFFNNKKSKYISYHKGENVN